jgi:hypothetical protein
MIIYPNLENLEEWHMRRARDDVPIYVSSTGPVSGFRDGAGFVSVCLLGTTWLR